MLCKFRGVDLSSAVVRLALALAAALSVSSCGPRAAAPERPWREFLADTTNVLRLALGDAGGTRLISTADPRGGNDDFNQFAGPGTEPGWVTIAELRGPGVVRRFWTTGADPGHRYRFYFDGEKTPRIEGDVDSVFGGQFPFQPPLAMYLNLCWFSYVPLTYQRSLRIETQAPNTHPFWGPRRIFFQLNVEDLPKGTRVETFPRALSEEDRAAWAQVAAEWRRAVEWPAPDGELTWVRVDPGQEVEVAALQGPALAQEWFLDIRPAEDSGWTQAEREALLQDAVLRIRYDGRSAPSVESPVGDFFGCAWRRRDYGALLIGAGPDAFRCGFPLAFTGSASISVFNGADRVIRAGFRAEPQPLPPGVKPRYFHAEWRRTGPDAGLPHTIASFAGSGLFAGAFLGVTGAQGTPQDDSWWLLEGDESIFVDDEPRPSWRGTGLEDYFNGGWYYRCAAFSAFHGIFDRAPFRVAQYRHQLVDPVRFSTSLRMVIERGDQNVSRAWFQSVAFAYLDEPAAVQPVPARREDRRAVPNRFEWANLMLQLTELERMNNLSRARALIAEYLERFPDALDRGVYALRDLEYRRLMGESVADDVLGPFLAGEQGEEAKRQAELLAWFYAATNRALVGINANAQAQLWFNGRLVARTDHPIAWQVAGVELTGDTAVVCVDATMVRQEPWVQFGLRTHTGFTGSGLETKRARRVSGAWNQLEGDTTAWQPMLNRDLLRGTPDAPFIGSVPNAFVWFGSKTFSGRAEDWGYHKGRGYFRQDIRLPVNGLPPMAPLLTGLPE
ncbi:MAG: DUF2961 domain-containing protein [Kiritimatiellae bacterium]|nr:DUF2961 domain-containing protein [Kiritimatiellia bacterium]MDW8457770.1 glycoside hydrolase family 172 protein [Verrucomicrobiota bacterium]